MGATTERTWPSQRRARRGSQTVGHIATLPYEVFPKLVKHPLTDAGLQKLLEDGAEARPTKATV